MVDTANTTSDRTRAQDGKPDDEKPRTRRGWGPRDEALLDEARRQRDEPISTSRRCKPSPQLRHAIRLLNREINNGLCCLPEDEQGHAFLIIMRALGLPPEQMLERDARWWLHLTEEEQDRRNVAYRCFDATQENILKLIIETTGLTIADLRKYAYKRVPCGQKRWKWETSRWRKWNYPMRQLLQLLPVDEQQRERANERRKAKRQQARAEAERAAQGDPREAALIKAIKCPDGTPVPNIIHNIERNDDRTLFPHKYASLCRTVHRLFDRLEQRGVVATETVGKRGHQVRVVSLRLRSSLTTRSPR